MAITLHRKSPKQLAIQPQVLTSISALDLLHELEVQQKLLEAASRHQEKCESDATEFLRFYWGDDIKNPCIELEKMTDWLRKNEPFDRWFFIHLIEAAGHEALERGVSQIASNNAKSKNASARAWVLSNWEIRSDQEQKKSEFARVYALLLKNKFSLNVNPETIARAWLPKTKK